MEDYFKKIKNKKTKAKKTQKNPKPIKKLQERLQKYYSNLSEDEKFKKVKLKLETKNCQMKIEKEKKNI